MNAGARRAIGVRRIQLWRMSAGTLRLSVRPAGGSGLEHRHQTPWIVGPDAKHPIVRQMRLDGVASPHVVHPTYDACVRSYCAVAVMSQLQPLVVPQLEHT